MKYLLTQDGVTLVIAGKPYSISAHSTGFAEVRDAVLEGRDPIEVLGIIQHKAIRIQEAVRETLKRQQLTGTLTYEEGVIFYNGAPLYNYAVETLIKFLNMGHDIQALANFIDKQQRNPDPMVHEELYRFLEHGKIPLTPDGDFLVYKAVRGDYLDIHSGTFDNRVGKKPRLPGREAVDPNRHNTCSNGLHVCSYGYLPHFANANGHVMVCKVNPVDVVAIPADYNNTKMRVVGYEVVGEVTGYYQRGEDVLAQERLRDPERWVVHYSSYPDDDVREVFDSFFTLDEAKAQADEIAGNSDVVGGAWVVDKTTGETVYET